MTRRYRRASRARARGPGRRRGGGRGDDPEPLCLVRVARGGGAPGRRRPGGSRPRRRGRRRADGTDGPDPRDRSLPDRPGDHEDAAPASVRSRRAGSAHHVQGPSGETSAADAVGLALFGDRRRRARFVGLRRRDAGRASSPTSTRASATPTSVPTRPSSGFVVRMAESPLNAVGGVRVVAVPIAKSFPAALTAKAEPSHPGARAARRRAQAGDGPRRDRQPALHALFRRRRQPVDLRPDALRRRQRHLRSGPLPLPRRSPRSTSGLSPTLTPAPTR